MLAKMLQPQVDLAILFLRMGLAAIFIVHGIFKVTQSHPLRPELTLFGQQIVGWTELIAGGALLLGLFSRVAALAVAGVQVGAIFLITGKYVLQGPPIHGTGADYTKVGPEYNLVLIAMCLSVMVLGSGVVSLDHLLWSWWNRGKAPATPQPVAGAAGIR